MSEKDLDKEITEGLSKATQLQLRGETQASIDMLDELEARARQSGHRTLAYILIQKAGWLRELGRREEAKSALEGAESACLAIPAQFSPLAALRMEQGIVARQAGDLVKAESVLNEAQKLVDGTPLEVVMMSDILANLSTVYSDQGRLEDAQTALLKALEYDQKTGDARALASNLNMLGLAYLNAGDRKTARLYLTQSREVATAAGLAKERADATQNLAIVSEQEGNFSEAKAGFQKALEEATRTGRRADIASAKSSLGILAARAGQFADADNLFAEAYQLHSDLGLADFCATDLINLSQNSLSLHHGQAALDHARAALAMSEKHGPLNLLWAAHYCVAKGQAAAMSEKPDPAILRDVMASYVNAVESIELLRGGIGRPEEREHVLVDKEQVFQEGMMLAGVLRQGSMAWKFAERARGRAFLDSLGVDRVGRIAARHPLAVRRAELTEQVLNLHATATPEAQALLDELRMVRSLIAAQAPAIAAVTEMELPGIEQVAAVLPPDSALVEFFFGPGNLFTAFVLNKKGLASMQTLDCGPNDLPGLIEQFRAELQYGVPEEPTGKLLQSVLFLPIWHAIEPVGRLFIVPHRQLHYLPMSALWFKNTGEGPEHLYMCQRFEMSIVPSAAYLVRTLTEQRTQGNLADSVVLGNPTQDLPSSAIEAAAVAKLLQVEPVLGRGAVRSQVLGISKPRAVIHIASHGVYEERDPLLSGVLLADGRLSVQDLLDAHIPADLLTLSGCLTGMSAQQPGDELVGLSRAAFLAGISTVVTALWEVPDDSTREFFERFYGHLSTGLNKDSALGRTQRSMLADPRYQQPANWAPFVLLGDGR